MCVLVICILLFTVFYIVSFMYIYPYLFCLYQCKDCCHLVTTQLNLVVVVLVLISVAIVTFSLLIPIFILFFIILFISSFTSFSPSPPSCSLPSLHSNHLSSPSFPTATKCHLQYPVPFPFHFVPLYSGIPEVKEPISSNTRHDVARSSH